MPPSRHHDVLPNAPHLPLLSFIPRRHSFFFFLLLPLYLFPFRLQSGLFSPLLPSDPISLFPPPTGEGKGPNLLAAVTEGGGGGGEGGACARSPHRKGDEDGAPMSYFSPRPPLPSPPRLSCHGSGFSGAVGRLGLQKVSMFAPAWTQSRNAPWKKSLGFLLFFLRRIWDHLESAAAAAQVPKRPTNPFALSRRRKEEKSLFRGDKERKRRWGSFSSSPLPKRPSFLSALLGERPR